MTPFELVTSKLQGLATKKDGLWALCPAHDDTTPSLKVWQSDDGACCVKCHSQKCSTKAILAAIGLEPKDLFPPRDAKQPAKRGKKQRGRIVDTYSYTDEGGEEVFQVLRYEPKDFRQRRWNPELKIWNWSLGGITRVLFHLPQLKEAIAAGRTIYLAEGEKDVQRLEKAGVDATCNPAGAGNWRPEFSEQLRGAMVVIIRDKDEAGYKHCAKVFLELTQVGCGVRAVEAAEGKDAFDHLHAGYTVDEFVPIENPLEKWPKPPKEPAAASQTPGMNESVQLAVVDGGAVAPPPATPIARVGHEPEPPKDFAMTDLGNAYRLVDLFGQDLRYCAEMGKGTWFAWDGTIWAQDRNAGASVQNYAIRTIRAIWRYADTLEWGSEKRGKWFKFAEECESRARIENMIALARKLPGIPIIPDDLDRNAMLIGCPNGTLDLATGEMVDADRKHLITRRLGVPYNKDAQCHVYQKWLAEMLRKDKELYRYLWRAKAITLMGHNDDEVIEFLHGPGGGGKGTVLGVLSTVMGDYANLVRWEVLKQKKTEQIPVEVADLRGCRLAYCDETEEHAWFDEQLLKTLSGGRHVKARFMRENPITIPITWTLWIAGNHKPRIKSFDASWQRRLKLLPFDNEIPREQQDSRIKRTMIETQGEGVLAEMVKALMAYHKAKEEGQGNPDPECVAAAVEEYKRETDTLGRFVEEWCEKDNFAEEPVRKLYLAFKAWARITDEYCGSETWFGRLLSLKANELGIKKERRTSGFVYTGLALKSEHERGGGDDPKYSH